MLKTITALIIALKRSVAGIQSCLPLALLISVNTGFLKALVGTKLKENFESCNITGGITWI